MTTTKQVTMRLTDQDKANAQTIISTGMARDTTSAVQVALGACGEADYSRRRYEVSVVKALRDLLAAARDPKQFGLAARCVDADDALAEYEEAQLALDALSPQTR